MASDLLQRVVERVFLVPQMPDSTYLLIYKQGQRLLHKADDGVQGAQRGSQVCLKQQHLSVPHTMRLCRPELLQVLEQSRTLLLCAPLWEHALKKCLQGDITHT